MRTRPTALTPRKLVLMTLLVAVGTLVLSVPLLMLRDLSLGRAALQAGLSALFAAPLVGLFMWWSRAR